MTLGFLEAFQNAGTSCANGSGYEGVSFDIEGNFGTCEAYLYRVHVRG